MNEHEALEAIRRWDLTGIEREIVDVCERLLARIEELEGAVGRPQESTSPHPPGRCVRCGDSLTQCAVHSDVGGPFCWACVGQVSALRINENELEV